MPAVALKNHSKIIISWNSSQIYIDSWNYVRIIERKKNWLERL